MLFHLRYCLFFMLISLLPISFAYAVRPITVDFNQADVREVIRVLAHQMNINVMVSHEVNGYVTLRLHEVMPAEALRILLTSEGLVKKQSGRLWVIAKPGELRERQEEEIKWNRLLEESAPLQSQLWRLKYGNAQTIAHMLGDGQTSLLSERGRVRVDTRTNTLYIQDIADRLVSIQHLVKKLDIPVQQIAIEARLISIDSDVERELGLRFATRGQMGGAIRSESSFANVSEGAYTLALLNLGDHHWLDVKLSALEKTGQAELMSNPSLFTANQETASIEAGEEIPYQETSESGGTAAVFKKAVLALKVTPQVLPDNRILLQLKINQDRPSNKLVQGVPTISTRQIVTSVLAHSGQTVVLGGIFEVNQEAGREQIPYLSQIPLLGRLFSQHNRRSNKRELLIFVTPRILP